MDGQSFVPTPPVPDQSNMSQPPMMPPVQQQSPRVGLIVGAVVAVAVLAGGGAFAYTQLNVPAPEKAMAEMAQHLTQVTSYAYATRITATGQVPNPLNRLSDEGAEGEVVPTSIIEAEASGSVDLKDKTKGAITLKLSMRPENDPDNRMTIGFDVLTASEISYIKLNQAPTLGLFDAFIAPLKGQWIKLDPASLGDNPLLGSDLGKKESPFSPEQIKQLQAAFVESKVVALSEKLGTDDGMYHYKVTMDKAAIGPLLDKMSTIMGEPAPSASDKADIEVILKNIALTNGELWLGKRDFLPRKALLTFEYNDPEKKTKVTVTSLTSIDKYNEPVVIEVPTSAKTIEEVFGGLFGGDSLGGSSLDSPSFDEGNGGINLNESGTFGTQTVGMGLSESRTKARDSKRFSDMRQLQTALELYYVDHESYPIVKTPVSIGSGAYACLGEKGFAVAGCTMPYMGFIPTDPTVGDAYMYSSVDGKTYLLTATLEGEVSGFHAGPIKVTPVGITQ